MSMSKIKSTHKKLLSVKAPIEDAVNKARVQELLNDLKMNPTVMKRGSEMVSIAIPKTIKGWPSFQDYQYSSVLYLNKENSDCTKKSVVKWAKEQGPSNGFDLPKEAVLYKSWACQMGIQEVHTLGLLKKDRIFVYRRYIRE